MSLRADLEMLTGEHWESSRVKLRTLSNESDLIYATYDCPLAEDQKDLVFGL